MGKAVDPLINFYYNTGMATDLLNSVMRQGEVGLILGHRQAGKTTTAFEAIREGVSQGLAVHYVSLQEMTVRSQKLLKFCVASMSLREATDLKVPQAPALTATPHRSP